MPAIAPASAVWAAVMPDPQYAATGTAGAAPTAANARRNASGSRKRPDSVTAAAGRLRAPRDVPGHGVEGLDLAAVPLWGPRVQEHAGRRPSCRGRRVQHTIGDGIQGDAGGQDDIGRLERTRLPSTRRPPSRTRTSATPLPRSIHHARAAAGEFQSS